MTKRALRIALLLLFAGCNILPTGPGSQTVEGREHKILSPKRAAEGTRFVDKFLPIDNQPGELVWLRGCEVEQSKQLQESYLSRAEVSLLRRERHGDLMKVKRVMPGTLFQFSPEFLKLEFPEGYGIPMMSNEPLNFITESKASPGNDFPLEIGFTLKLDYLRNRGLRETIRPLYCVPAVGLVAVDGKPRYFGLAQGEAGKHGLGTANSEAASTLTMQDDLGQVFTNLWFLKPGRHRVSTLQTHILRLGEDQTLHFASGQLIGPGESLELRDITTNTSIFKLGHNGEGKLESFSSEEGVALPKDHHYELVAEFNNEQAFQVRAAAALLLYFADEEFRAEEIHDTP